MMLVTYILLKLKICDYLSVLVNVENNKNVFSSKKKYLKIKVYLVVNISLKVKFTVEQNDETAIVFDGEEKLSGNLIF